MARAKAETSLIGELFQVRPYKPAQGRVVRQVTALAIAVTAVLIAYRLHATALADSSEPIRRGIPAAIGLLGVWLAYRLVNWPTFANFLISVDAEMEKVSWASWEYLKRATAVVLVTMVVLGGYLFFCDIIWQQLFIFVRFLDPRLMGA
ncbi:preprotein translocase subunit SecE [Planctomicrobium sp. SH664]|uniref:preprotein translocase subunit SecE n=1 Tax=Planctomicrobium sp. SH664 TaxID=3448125 RepID=UPI003F5BB653